MRRIIPLGLPPTAVALILLLAPAACAVPGTSTMSRTAPPESRVDTEAVVDGERRLVRDRLVAALSTAPFELEEAPRGTDVIEASFSVSDPERYIDCGTTTRTYRRGGERQTFTYPLAAGSTYRWAMGAGSHDHLPLTYEIDRETDLDARIRIRLDAEDGSTRVGVSPRYTLSIDVTGDYVLEAANGAPIDQGPVVPQTYEVTFRTNQPNWTDLGTDEDRVWVSCVSTGELERRILEMAGEGR